MEISDLFRECQTAFRQKHSRSGMQAKVMQAIINCRTAALGGHVDGCDDCGHLHISYNSCRNRHCPKCQSIPKEKWILARKQELLPVPYFHLVFTLPDTLNPLVLNNPKAMYKLLFKAGSETLLELAQDKKLLGAQTGMIAILHTWGQCLQLHPHIHCIVPGGGLSQDKKRWVAPKGKKGKFLMPVKILSKVFKGKYLAGLKQLQAQNKLRFLNTAKEFQSSQGFKKLLNKVYKKNWVVYAKPPFSNTEQVIKYLARYTHRVAISNERLLGIKDDKVTFRWKDYREGGKKKLMTLDVLEFIRRFLMHVLPHGFAKIRHYGLLSNRKKKELLAICRKLLYAMSSSEENIKDLSWQQVYQLITGKDPLVCPKCSKGKMSRKRELPPVRAAPMLMRTV